MLLTEVTIRIKFHLWKAGYMYFCWPVCMGSVARPAHVHCMPVYISFYSRHHSCDLAYKAFSWLEVMKSQILHVHCLGRESGNEVKMIGHVSNKY